MSALSLKTQIEEEKKNSKSKYLFLCLLSLRMMRTFLFVFHLIKYSATNVQVTSETNNILLLKKLGRNVIYQHVDKMNMDEYSQFLNHWKTGVITEFVYN